jgi:LPXTG-motif cell wall-anchored protein
MKKSLAALGATVLGVTGALVASAAPAGAQPAPAPLPCNTAVAHNVSRTAGDPSAADWYMDCIPQYGMGKAEFTTSAPSGETFPAGYSLTDGKQTVTSSTPTAAQVEAYFGTFYAQVHNTSSPTYTGAFINLTEDVSDSTATSQEYQEAGGDAPMTVAFPITSVGKLTGGLPAACSPDGETYQGEYVIHYAPVTTTFAEVIADKTYTTTVTLTAPTLELGLNFDAAGSFGFDDSAALCATSTLGTVFAASSTSQPLEPVSAPAPTGGTYTAADLPTGSEAWNTIANDAATNDPRDLTTLIPTSSALDDEDQVPLAFGPFTTTATPILAETGVNAVPAGILGGSLLIAGLGAFVYGRRRRVGTHRP